jgi:hypothetical protein
MQYGVIPTDMEGVPDYSGKVADSWGYSGPSENFINVGKTHLIKSAALVKTWDEVVTALTNGYPVTIASYVGYSMKAGRDGFHVQNTSWAHAMCIIGVDNEYSEPHACVLNSWGPAHGEIKDFKTGEAWPKGTIRARRQDIGKAITFT